MKKEGTLSLFEEDLSCQDCVHNWHGYLHGFSRGHSVLTKDGHILFIPDDLGYCFPDDFDFEYLKLFHTSGWKDLEACPACGSTNLFPPKYDQSSVTNVACIMIEASDLKRSAGQWILTDSGEEKIEQDL